MTGNETPPEDQRKGTSAPESSDDGRSQIAHAAVELIEPPPTHHMENLPGDISPIPVSLGNRLIPFSPCWRKAGKWSRGSQGRPNPVIDLPGPVTPAPVF